MIGTIRNDDQIALIILVTNIECGAVLITLKNYISDLDVDIVGHDILIIKSFNFAEIYRYSAR